LVGFSYNDAGKRCWATALAAEYPESLCDVVVGAFLEALKKEPDRGPTLHHVFTAQGRTSRIEDATKKAEERVGKQNMLRRT
jgi:hypothetical protein